MTKKLIVLDIDHTLIHCFLDNNRVVKNHDFSFIIDDVQYNCTKKTIFRAVRI